MTDSFDIRNCFASLSPSGQHPLRGAGWLLSLCSPAGCLRQAISAALRFAVLGSAFGIFPDPACGSGGMFVQSEKFVESHGDVAKFEIRSASVEVKPPCSFVTPRSPLLALLGIEANFANAISLN